MSEYTPGPWFVVDRPRTGMEEHAYAVEPVCFMFGSFPYPQQEASARLIAAAPDLLDVLRNVTDRFEKQLAASGKFIPRHIRDEHYAAIANARAILAKATMPLPEPPKAPATSHQTPTKGE